MRRSCLMKRPRGCSGISPATRGVRATFKHGSRPRPGPRSEVRVRPRQWYPTPDLRPPTSRVPHERPMILFDYDKAVHLMGRSGIDVLLPHTLLNAGYLADHWYHLVNTTVGPYTTFDVDETYQLFVGLPRDRKIDPFVTCRRGAEEGEMHVWDVWIEDKRR